MRRPDPAVNVYERLLIELLADAGRELSREDWRSLLEHQAERVGLYLHGRRRAA